MKKYIYIAIIALAGVISSCGDDFLRLYPHTDVTTGAPANRDFIDANVTAAYQLMLFDCYADGQWMPVNMFFEALSDNVYTGGADANDQGHLQRAGTFNAHPSIQAVTGWWRIFYPGLKRANEALHAIDNSVMDLSIPQNVTWLADKRAEMLTLRAYYVHWLWKAYGNIPYFTDPWTAEPFVAKQHTFDEIYPILLADLDAAIAETNFPMTRARGGADRGRVHKSFAMMTRARIVMYYKDQSRYTQVLQDMRNIIAQPDYALVTAIPQGAVNFTGRRGSNTGAVAPPTTNHFEWIFLSQDPTVAVFGGGEFSSESIFEVSSSPNNGKTWGNAWQGFGNYSPRFTGPRGAIPDDRFATGWGFLPVREDAYAIFEDADYRKDATVSDWSPRGNFQDTGLWLRKYAPRFGYNVGSGGDRDLNWTNNKRIFRIAEAYLIAAELSYYAGGQGAAQGFLDPVRDRAFRSTTNRVQATLENIMRERRLEFFGEGLRFWDLMRWGQDENGNSLSQTLNTAPPTHLQTRTWEPHRKFLPIPQSEINRVALSLYPLKQNEGYE